MRLIPFKPPTYGAFRSLRTAGGQRCWQEVFARSCVSLPAMTSTNPHAPAVHRGAPIPALRRLRERNIFTMMEEDDRQNVEPDQPARALFLSILDLLQVPAGAT
jgi:hypothetical protein